MNGVRVDFKAVPGIVWICLTVAFLGIVTALVVLAATGSDATEFRAFLNMVMNAAMLLVTGSGAIYAGAAARNAQATKEQTNGALDERIRLAVTESLDMQRADDVAVAYNLKGVTDDG